MRPESSPDGQTRPSFIEAARRAQIIDSAIETFTELGFTGTSLARIAERAGISKGVISYHFAGKTELMEQIVERVYRDISQFVLTGIADETTATGQLRATVRTVAAYMRDHRAQLLAFGEIVNNLRGPDGRRRFDITTNEPIYEGREALLRRGQAAGEFRDFDVRVMAVTIQAALDDMFAYWIAHPEHDLEAHADELADLFEHATRAGDPAEADR
jgi:TetR/AcrR family transcriptional regulator, fatty acid metabolism regulator protein